MFDCNHFLHRNGWRQRDLAERLGLGASTVGMWCAGKSTPPYEVIVGLIKLGVTPSELFGEEIDSILQRFYSVKPTGNYREEEGEKPITRAEAVEIFKELYRDK